MYMMNYKTEREETERGYTGLRIGGRGEEQTSEKQLTQQTVALEASVYC